MSEIEDAATLAIVNALNTEVREKYGEDVTRTHTLVISLIEWPRVEGDNPGTPRIQMSLKTLEPIPTKTAGIMLRKASVQFQRAAQEGGN